MSGDFLVAFSPDYAERVARDLADQSSDLLDAFDAYRRKYGKLPVPIMRFPHVPQPEDERVRIAEVLRRDGYDTIIVLPLPQGVRRHHLRDEIEAQLGELTGNTVLFCRNIEQLAIESSFTQRWSVTREGPQNNQTISIRHEQAVQYWRVIREEGHIPSELLEQDFQETREFEVGVAVPEDVQSASSDNTLCVYFGTDDALPSAMVAHATLATKPPSA